MKKKYLILGFILTQTALQAIATSPGIYFVDADKLKVRMGPDSKFEHVYSIKNKDRVKVHEIKNGWARISYYKKDTNEAKWVFAKFLSGKNNDKAKEKLGQETPKNDSKNNDYDQYLEEYDKEYTFDELMTEALKKSDDYEKYQKTFELVTRRLIFEKTCKLSEVRRLNGWLRLYNDKTYFLYCGGYSKENKIYLDVTTGIASK